MSWHHGAAGDRGFSAVRPSAPLDGRRRVRWNLVAPSNERLAPSGAYRPAP